MSDIAIRVEALGKQYRIGRAQERSTTLREAIASTAGGAARALGAALRLRSKRGPGTEMIWALRDVGFEVPRGTAVGIIGGNGAGKSTLLKLLSRITQPTTGNAWIQGRVGSLLEVGTGFHPELTGRENIYLNGSILGMKRSELGSRFDEIVAFAEVEKFIDTPVKRYSSGMYLRLAFAVAAHLEPEILIVDEVLAVGDASFQKKCLGKMDEVAHQGRTVLFVSHNMDAVRRLCSRCVLLEGGRVATEGDAATVTSRYLMASLTRGKPGEWIEVSNSRRSGTGLARLRALRYGGSRGAGELPTADGPLEVTLDIVAEEPVTVRCLSLMINDTQGCRLLNVELATTGEQLELGAGSNLVQVAIEQLHLNAGSYTLGVWMGRSIEDDVPIDHLESATTIEVVDPEPEGFAYPWATAPVTCRYRMRLLARPECDTAATRSLSNV